jgi:hypothetical protein
MTGVIVLADEAGNVQPFPRHALSAMSGTTKCGKQGGAVLPSLRFEQVPLEERCEQCMRFDSTRRRG